MEEEFKRWTAKRKPALVMEIIQGKTTVAETSRSFDIPPSQIEEWTDEGRRDGERPACQATGCERTVRAATQAAAGSLCRSHAGAPRQQKNGVLAGRGRQVIETIRQGLKKDGFDVAGSKTCAWFGIARRSAYYKPVNAEPKVQECFAEPVRKIILEEPSFGYRMVVGLLGFNKNTVLRFFLLKGRRVKKCPICFRPSVKALPSVATGPVKRWATDLCRIWTGCEGWAVLALVIDCYTWELLGWHLSRSGKLKTAESALERALIL